MSLDTVYISVSGQPSVEELRIPFPSGDFGIFLDAELAELQASFGFNQNAHRFDLQYIPNIPDGQNIGVDLPLPNVGSGVEFSIGNFYIKGRIKHADYAKSTRGKILSVSVEDLRTDLAEVYIDTYGLYANGDAPGTNIVDVRYWFATQQLTSVGSVSQSELDTIEQNGASYRQIYNAIDYFQNQVGTITNVLETLPLPAVIEEQLPLDQSAYRWRFRGQNLLNAIARVFNDIAYDFYYNMQDDQINVINRKFGVQIDEEDIPIPGDTNPTISTKYGQDEGERASNVRVFGGEMEGLAGSSQNPGSSEASIPSTDLTPTNGYYGSLSVGTYDLGIAGLNSFSFIPGWAATLKYFGQDGFLNEYEPTDRELAAALKGIEYWALEIGLDNRIGDVSVQTGTGATTVQESVTGSGIGLIPNRRQEGRSWIVEWYNRVRTHAQNNFGRTYILDPTSDLYAQIDEFDVPAAAWCNLENQTDEGSFVDGYKISEEFRWLAPFWDADNNKLRAFGTFDIRTKWGVDGEQTPARFTEWNEGEEYAVVPIEARKFDTSRQRFQEDFLTAIEENQKGVVIRLPAIAWDWEKLADDEDLLTIDRLSPFSKLAESNTTTIDVPNPYRIVKPYDEIFNIVFPITVRKRYGTGFPEIWASGTGPRLELVTRDDFVPWEFQPRGQLDSVELMNDSARSVLNGRVVERSAVTFAEANKVGLPVIAFDQYANQQLNSQGYGIVSHGITSLTVTKNTNWWTTKYNVKSHFPQPIKAIPIQEGIEEDFNFAIKRLEEDIRRRVPIIPFDPPDLQLPTDDGRASIKSDSGIEHVIERNVTIVQVFGRGTTNEYYLGEDERGVRWPRALDGSFGSEGLQQATGIDGFFQVGMQAVYRLEKQWDGSVQHYFKGGIPLSETRVVQLLEAPRQIDEIFVANVQTLSTFKDQNGQVINIDPFTFNNVKFMNQNSVDTSLRAGDFVQISTPQNKKEFTPGANYGPGEDREDDAFLVNSGGGTDNTGIAFVITRPGSGGRGGAIQTVEATGGQQFRDQQATGGQVYNIFFVGVEPEQVAIGDYCFYKQFAEVDEAGQQRIYCFISKPVFIGGNALGT